MASVKKNYIYESLYQILILIVPFIVSPYVARVLKAEGVGVYSYTSAIVAYFEMFAILGIRNYGGRTVARYQDKRERSRVFWEIFTAHFVLSVIAVLLYVFYVIFAAQYRKIAWLQGMNILAALLDISWFFTGTENFKILTIRNGILKIATCAAVFLLVKKQDDVVIYVAILSFGTLSAAISLIPCARKYICWVKPEWRDAREHFKPVFILAIPTFLTTIYMTMDKILLGFFVGNREVAYYENSEKTLIVRNFIYSIGTVMLPRISALYAQKDYSRIKGYIRQAIELSLIMCCAFSFGLMACADKFAPWFWGQEFTICGRLIHYAATMMFFNTVANTIRVLYLIPLNRDKEYIISSAFGAVSNVLLDILLIPRFMAEGAWMATLLSAALVCLYQLWVVRKELPMLSFCLEAKYYFILGAGMMLICKALGFFTGSGILGLMVQMIAGGVIYTLGCYIYWKRNGKNFYLNILKRIRDNFKICGK